MVIGRLKNNEGGHIHADSDYNRINRGQGIKRYDVCVDANNFMPISIKQILQFYSVGG